MTKRLFDCALAGIGLIVSAPLWLAIAAAIRLEDGGPIFFRQQRVGRGGGVFDALKFRSMIPDAEALTGPVQATENDPRVTRVGRLLRATAMDELPQLWNIFAGDMSFVGPRPLRPGEVEVRGDGQFVRLDDIPGYEARHSVRPGLTGLACMQPRHDAAVMIAASKKVLRIIEFFSRHVLAIGVPLSEPTKPTRSIMRGLFYSIQ